MAITAQVVAGSSGRKKKTCAKTCAAEFKRNPVFRGSNPRQCIDQR
jgi:hypothetical protein